jgi:anthranilate synthase component 2
MKPILVLDNYDSFTYNLVHLLESISSRPVEVYRNDQIGLVTLDHYERVLISPGPGLPDEAGNTLQLIREAPASVPILGVCLGHQALAVATGGNLFQLPMVQHGIATEMFVAPQLDRLKLFQGLPEIFEVGRYHSWMVATEGLSEAWLVNARDAQGRILSMVHKYLPWQGVQFHPESVMTLFGREILSNWCNNC